MGVTQVYTKTKKNKLTGRTKTTTRRVSSDGSSSKSVEKRRKDGSLKKRVTKGKMGDASYSRKATKTKDVQKQSRSGRKVVVKNKTTRQGKLPGIDQKRTVKAKTVLKARKTTRRKSGDDLKLKKQTVKRTVGKGLIRKVTGKSKATGGQIRDRDETMRGYTTPKNVKIARKKKRK
mgnify:CR=1 FL=1|tara:strand:+ start:57 stop:584 length:528 start_codon:yes stop_codon:yes gene_type:complete